MGIKRIVPSVLPQKKYFTYALRDSGHVFYVGKGTGKRLQTHETHARNDCPCKKCHAIRHVWDRGEDVLAEILYETDVERDALVHEWALINMIFAGPHLTNYTGNVYETERRREKQAARWKNLHEEWSHERREAEQDCVTYLTATEAMHYLGISRPTFYQNIQAMLPEYKQGARKRILYRQSDLDQYRGFRPSEGNED